VTSYKVMVSNDSHTWVTVKNGSGDMVSLVFPLTMPFSPGCVGLCRERQCMSCPWEVCQFCDNSNQPRESDGQ
jgi:membrane-associated PAP2 superfamily phosphatase